ncbi:hypothetical protein H2198_002543 [Neophaeococcomyces mojaviensis]|uniref:Uncharacterized protein n=1 Tax=Neophaeococcomyces mojaviensis TaxID=3383035 RepID=A0ACC3ADS6_9EURO|nr:hypothetical protein H2198_002543 [Knufia sp. JES_112]
MGHGLNFLNCRDAQGHVRSGIAYYNDIGDHNIGEQPQDFVYTDDAGNTHWESNDEQSAAFANGTLVKWQIEPDAQSKNQNDVVGWASNPYQRFTVHKADKGKWIFKNNDGYDCFAVYYAY